MKKIILLLLFPFFLIAQAEDYESIESQRWLKDYETALAEAHIEKRNVLVYFTGSDWCPPCKMLKKDLFDSEEFKSISQNYTLLYIDIPRNKDLLTPEQLLHNNKLLSIHNKKKVFPLIVILNHKGKELDTHSGYSMNGEIQYHVKLLNKYKG